MSNHNLKDDEHAAVAEFVHAFKDTMAALGAAAEVRYQAAPGTLAARGRGQDPTADTVTDPDRVLVDSAILACKVRLRRVALDLREATQALETALEPYSR